MQWRLSLQNKVIHLMNFFYLLSDYRASLQCIRTMTCDYALCSLFAPGDRHVIIGTKVRNCSKLCCFFKCLIIDKLYGNFHQKSGTECINFHLPKTA